MPKTFNELEECEIQLTLLVNDKPVELANIVSQVIINQSIDSPFITGHIICTDSKDLPSVYRLNGNETLSLFADLPGLNKPLQKTFRVFSLEKRSTSKGTSTTNFVINFCSNEIFSSLTTRVSKAYKNAKISDIVLDVLINYLNLDNIDFIDSTAGSYDVVAGTWRPFEFLNWLSTRAYDADKTGYHFYETQNGYCFKSLQTMFNDVPDSRQYTYDVKAVDDGPGRNTNKDANRYSFNKFQIVRDFDIMRSTGSGAFSTNLLAFDLKNQNFKSYNYNLIEAASSTLNQNPNSSSLDLILSTQNHLTVYPITKDGVDELGNQIDLWLPRSILHKNLINSFVINTSMPGNILIVPGTSIFFNMPTFNVPNEKGKEFSDVRSGKYLVRDVVHLFTQINGSNFKFITNLGLCSDSLSVQLESSQ